MKREKAVIVKVRVPAAWIREIDELIAKRGFDTRSGAIRVGIRLLLLKERELAA